MITPNASSPARSDSHTADWILVGDIGGTNVRLALVSPDRPGFESLRALQCSDYDNLDSAVRDYLRQVGVEKVSEACLAVASPIRGTRVEMTNNPWRFDTAEVAQKFGWRRFRVINDFLALALGIPQVEAGQLIKVCGGSGDVSRPRLIIGPGTGLGVAGLVPGGDGWIALESEGGHVDFAPVTERDMAILKTLQARFGRISAERVLCGPGLVNLYQAHARLDGLPESFDSAGQITQAATADQSPDPLARQTLEHFCEILGRVAGDATLTLGARGGVYLCGGVLPRFVDFFLNSSFQRAFEDKGRMRSLMEDTPVYLVTEPYLGVMGAAEAVRNSPAPTDPV